MVEKPSDRQKLGLEKDSSVLEELFGNSQVSVPKEQVKVDSSSDTTSARFLSTDPSQKTTYIAELDGEFVTLNYDGDEQEPLAVPLETQKLSTKGQPDQSELTKSSSVNRHLGNHSLRSRSSFSPFLGKKGLVWGIGLGVLLTLAGIRLFSANSSTESNSSPTEIPDSVAPAKAVTVTEVETRSIDRTLNVFGTVTPYEEIPVMSPATGLQITAILAEEGDLVSRGQILAQLDAKILQAEKVQAEAVVAQAQARLAELRAGNRSEEIAQAKARVNNLQSGLVEAKSNLDLIQKRVQRNQSLEAEGAITRDRLDEILNQERVAQSKLVGTQALLQEAKQELAKLEAGPRPQTIRQAEAELAQARGRLQSIIAQLEDTNVIAPSRGIIAEREAQVGEITSPSQVLFTIIENGRLELQLKVPETLIGQIALDQNVTITSDANSKLKLSGKVREIDPIIDESSRQAIVKVDLPAETNLQPGMFLRGTITTASTEAITVPIEALLPQSEGKAIAFVLQSDNTVKAQSVETGEILNERSIEIIQGLHSGDRIVLKGAAYLNDGDLVTTKSQI